MSFRREWYRLAPAVMAAISTLLWPQVASAQAPQPLQELFFASLPYVQDKAEFQATVTHSRSSELGNRHSQTSVAIEYGLSSRWQIELEATGREHQTVQTDHHTALESAGFSLERGLSNAAGSRRLKVGGEMEVPFGVTGSALRAARIGPSMALMQDVIPLHGLRVLSSGALSAPLSQGHAGEQRGVEHELQVAAFLPLSRARVSLEFSRRSSTDDDNSAETIAAPGLTLVLPRGVEFAIAAPFSLAQRPRSRSGVFRLVYEF